MVKTAFIIIREVQDWCVYMNLSLYINDPVPEFYVPSDWTFPRCVNSHLAICEPERSFTDTQWSPIRLGTCLASTKDNRACLKLKKKKNVWNMPYIGGREGSYSEMYLWHSNTIKDHSRYVWLVKLLMPNPVTVSEVQFYIYTKGHKMPFLKTRNTQKRLTWLVTEPTDFPPLSPEAALLIFSFPPHGLPSVMS